MHADTIDMEALVGIINMRLHAEKSKFQIGIINMNDSFSNHWWGKNDVFNTWHRTCTAVSSLSRQFWFKGYLLFLNKRFNDHLCLSTPTCINQVSVALGLLCSTEPRTGSTHHSKQEMNRQLQYRYCQSPPVGTAPWTLCRSLVFPVETIHQGGERKS